MFKILITDKLGSAGLKVFDQAADATYDLKLGATKEELLPILADYHGWVVRSETRPDAEMIAAAKNLKVIGRAGEGVDNIDVKAATAQGVIVMNTPGANSMATAEQTMALMLAVSRFTGHAHASMLRGEWERSKFTGIELYNKTLGIIGFGKIGKLVAARALAFGMKVIAADPFVKEEDARKLGVTLVDLDDLYAQSDYITLHTAATPETTKMINAQAISQMKEGVVILNVARGKLVDEAALLEGLNSGKVRAAGLDVFQTEPPVNNPLVTHPKVTHTPHLGASSVEAQRNVAVMVAEQILDTLRQKEVRNAVNLPFDFGPNYLLVRPYLELAEKLGHLQYHIATEPIFRVELDVSGELVEEVIRPIAASLLKGMLTPRLNTEVNQVNAPMLAQELGIQLSQTRGLSLADYQNYIACRVYWGNETHVIAGIVIGGKHPRVVQFSRYLVEGNPEGIVLLMRSRDVPGVISFVSSLTAKHNVNIGEWRMGRDKPGGEAMSFIALDNNPRDDLLEEIRNNPMVVKAKFVRFNE